MQCRAYRNGVRCPATAMKRFLRLGQDGTEIVLVLDLCEACSGVVDAMVGAYQAMASEREPVP